MCPCLLISFFLSGALFMGGHVWECRIELSWQWALAFGHLAQNMIMAADGIRPSTAGLVQQWQSPLPGAAFNPCPNAAICYMLFRTQRSQRRHRRETKAKESEGPMLRDAHA
ncbi:hypothetical protein LX36DRAFT_698037 [Colletotrichum falcatum]|nr:hypothetical protein LX36DRAFT_698037 [Colletotrichum falcatum]